MSHDLKKYYYECLAKNILEKYQSYQLGELILSDKPDLRSAVGIGIEVTRAVFDGFEEKSNYFNKYLKMKKTPDVEKQRIDNFIKDGTRIFYYNDMICGYVPPAIWYGIDELKNIYEKKRRKLCSYNFLKAVHLFIFSPSFNDYEKSDIEKFMEWISQNKNNEKDYDVIYIYQENILFICNVASHSIMEIVLDKSIIHQCCVYAKNYAQNTEVTP